MTIKTATPYLILSGKADAAIELYRRALGAEVELRQRFGDLDGSCPEALRDRVMHAALRIGKALVMLSDGPPETPAGAAPSGGSVSVALDLDDPEETRRRFDALATNGKVIQPLFDAPWGALFGVVLDEFGVSWMFNCDKKPG